MFNHWSRNISFVLGIMTVSVGSAALGQQLPADLYAHPQKLIMVEAGRRLNLFCVGKGEPTVLFDSGLGDGTLIWRTIQADVAKSTQTCSYDRANYFYSDTITRRATAQVAADDMLALINNAGLGKRVILVGHSRGGLNIRLFAYEHPDRVAGLVMIDPTVTEKLSTTTTRHYVQKYENYLRMGQKLEVCKQLAEQGRLTPDGSDPSKCLDDFDTTSDPNEQALDRETRRMETRATFQSTLFSERQNLFYPIDDDGDSTDGLSIVASERSLGDIPTIVIVANPFLLKTLKITPTPDMLQFFAWRKDQLHKLVNESTHGEFIEIGSMHYIQKEHPDVVLAAIHRVLMAVQSQKNLEDTKGVVFK